MSGSITVTIKDVRGSAPRDAGTAMQVWADRQCGTIGGGALEWHALQTARRLLKSGAVAHSESLPLGPNLGQCCGGHVTLTYDTKAPEPKTAPVPLWIWGAGHVGRALVHALTPLPHIRITWADTLRDRFPDTIPDSVSPLMAQDLPRVVPRASDKTHHLIVTYSHDIDLALCHALLARQAASIGLIGSATKWARFQNRLRDLGHAKVEIDRITCPIGDPKLGKHPSAIALGVATQVLTQTAQGGLPE